MKAGLLALTVVFSLGSLTCAGLAYASLSSLDAGRDAQNGLNILRVDSSNTPPVIPGGMLTPRDSANVSSSVPLSPNFDSVPYVMQQRMRQELGKPVATQAWTRTASIGQMAVVYFSLRGGMETDVLKSVSTPWAQKAEIHQTTIDEQGVARMSLVGNLDVASESSVEFSPQGMHIMLTGLKRDLRPQQFFPVLLHFEKAGIVRFMVTVRTPDGSISAPMMMMDSPSAPASTVDVTRGQPAHVHVHAPAATAPAPAAAAASSTATDSKSAAPSSSTGDTNTAPH